MFSAMHAVIKKQEYIHFYKNLHTHTHLTALFWDYPGEPVPER